jgi:hypothetical protein
MRFKFSLIRKNQKKSDQTVKRKKLLIILKMMLIATRIFSLERINIIEIIRRKKS